MLQLHLTDPFVTFATMSTRLFQNSGELEAYVHVKLVALIDYFAAAAAV